MGIVLQISYCRMKERLNIAERLSDSIKSDCSGFGIGNFDGRSADFDNRDFFIRHPSSQIWLSFKRSDCMLD